MLTIEMCILRPAFKGHTQGNDMATDHADACRLLNDSMSLDFKRVYICFMDSCSSSQGIMLVGVPA